MNGETIKTGLAAVGIFLLCDSFGVINWIRAAMGAL